MRVIVVGLGVQGRKRCATAGSECVATVDPVVRDALARDIASVPLSDYDAAMICTPYEQKADLITWCLAHGKHVLVEKPLWVECVVELHEIEALASSRGLVCYVAYNHRFEPHIERIRAVIASGELGRVYSCRMFYGNGTARNVRATWRDEYGALWEIGPHLLDLAREWFGKRDFKPISAHEHENASVDHVVIGARRANPYVDDTHIELEMTFLSWRNTFTIDVIAEHGSAHIEGLMKWGSSRFVQRTRVLPSGAPPEEGIALIGDDPTWEIEYEHFKRLCARGERCDLSNDLWIHRTIDGLGRRIRELDY